MKRALLSAVFLIACAGGKQYDCGFTLDRPPVDIYIDGGCTPADRELVLDALDELNATTEQLVGIPLLEPAGVTSGPEAFAIRCYDEEPAWYSGSEYDGLLGYGSGEGVELFWFRVPGMADNYKTAVILHELGHVIGLGHSDDPESAMFNEIDSLHYTYTSVDEREICASLSASLD